MLFCDWSLRNGHSQRTAFNWFVRVNAFLRAHGIHIATCKDAPRYAEPTVEVYNPDEVKVLLDGCRTERERAYFTLLLHSGLRMQESKYLERSDVIGNIVHVRPKVRWGWTTKNHESRTVTIPSRTAELLRGLPCRPGTLLFPTRSGQPDRHLLRHCKRVAQRAGLDPARWTLHGFRRTCVTTWLRGGMDLRTVMKQAGHKDIESTMRYLRPLEGDALSSLVARIWDI